MSRKQCFSLARFECRAPASISAERAASKIPFMEEGSLFDLKNEDAGAVVARAVMQVSVEVVVMTLYLLVGTAQETEWNEVAEVGRRSRVAGMAVHGRAVELTMVEFELGLRETMAGKGPVTGITQEHHGALSLLRSEEEGDDENESDEGGDDVVE